MNTVKILLSTEFFAYIKQHSDLWAGYLVSLVTGTGGITLMINYPVWEFIGLLGGIILTMASLILTIILSFKGFQGYRRTRLEVREKEISLRHLELDLREKEHRISKLLEE